MERNSTIALAIDFQEKLVPAMFNEEEFIANAKRLFRGLGVLGIQTIITQQYTRGLGETVWEICEAIASTKLEDATFMDFDDEEIDDYDREVAARVEVPEGDIDNGEDPYEDDDEDTLYLEYVEKNRFSAYEDIKEMIADDVKTVIISGCESHICVLQTAIDLKKAGYEVVLCADCVSSRRVADYSVALERAKQEGILMATHEMVLFELLEKAGTPEAKAIQKIVR